MMDKLSILNFAQDMAEELNERVGCDVLKVYLEKYGENLKKAGEVDQACVAEALRMFCGLLPAKLSEYALRFQSTEGSFMSADGKMIWPVPARRFALWLYGLSTRNLEDPESRTLPPGSEKTSAHSLLMAFFCHFFFELLIQPQEYARSFAPIRMMYSGLVCRQYEAMRYELSLESMGQRLERCAVVQDEIHAELEKQLAVRQEIEAVYERTHGEGVSEEQRAEYRAKYEASELSFRVLDAMQMENGRQLQIIIDYFQGSERIELEKYGCSPKAIDVLLQIDHMDIFYSNFLSKIPVVDYPAAYQAVSQAIDQEPDMPTPERFEQIVGDLLRQRKRVLS